MIRNVKNSIAVMLCLTAGAVFAAHPTKYTNVIVFGDAFADAGNNHWLVADGQTGAPFINEDPVTHEHPIWTNMLAEALIPGSKSYHSSQVQSAHIDPYTNSMSYGWSGAESGHYVNDDQTDLPFPPYNDDICNKHGPGYIEKGKTCVPGLRQQIAQYLKDVHNHPNPDTVFVIGCTNDLVNNYIKLLVSGRPMQEGMLASVSLTENKPGFEDLSYEAINTNKAKNDLIDAGVAPDHIFVLDEADFSQMPGFIQAEKNYPGILKLMHAATVTYNTNLRKALTDTNPRYDLPASHLISDFDIVDEIVNHPAKYGITNVTEGCTYNHAEPLCQGYAFYDDGRPTNMTSKLYVDMIKKLF